MPRFAEFDVEGLRKSSAVADFPWSETWVTLIRVDAKGVVRQAKSLTEKVSLLTVASDKDLVIASCPEIYAVDDLSGQAGGMPWEAIAATIEFAKAMRAVDRDIQVIAWGDSGWAPSMYDALGEHVRFVAESLLAEQLRSSDLAAPLSEPRRQQQQENVLEQCYQNDPFQNPFV